MLIRRLLANPFVVALAEVVAVEVLLLARDCIRLKRQQIIEELTHEQTFGNNHNFGGIRNDRVYTGDDSDRGRIR